MNRSCAWCNVTEQTPMIACNGAAVMSNIGRNV